MPDPQFWNALEAIGTWFAGVATAGSLWLGFTILKADRRREERSQASKVAIDVAIDVTQAFKGGKNWTISARLWNHSDQPIFFARLIGLWDDGRSAAFESQREGRDPLDDSILPSESCTRVETIPRTQSTKRMVVVFTDATGVEWKYVPSTRRLSKVKIVKTYLGISQGKAVFANLPEWWRS